MSVYSADWSTCLGGASASQVSNTLFYTGHEFDAATGLYYMRARYYDPTLGGFISRDPIGYDDGANLYAYCGDNPATYADPTGFVHGVAGVWWEPSGFWGENRIEVSLDGTSHDGCTWAGPVTADNKFTIRTGWTGTSAFAGPVAFTKPKPRCGCKGVMQCSTYTGSA